MKLIQKKYMKTDDLEKKYYDAAAFTIYPDGFVNSYDGAGSDEDYIGYVVPKEKAVDIDEEADWLIAESLYKHLNRKMT